MFALSFGKIVLLAAVIAAVWFGYRWWQRVQKVMHDEATALSRQRAKTPTGEDMVKCPTCETYLSPRAPGPAVSTGARILAWRGDAGVAGGADSRDRDDRLRSIK